MEKIKIALIIPKLVNKGPVIVAKDIVDSLSTKDIIFEVFYFDDVKEVEFACVTKKINLFTKINFNDYDVVHTHMLRPDFYIWLHRRKHHHSYFISTLHQDIFENLKGDFNFFIAYIFQKLWLFFLKKQDVIITLTNVMKSKYESSLKDKLRVIYNGRNYNILNYKIDNDELNILNDLKEKFKVIGSHCLLTKRKGIHQIINALVYLEDFAFIIVGDGKEMDSLIKLAKKNKVFNRCLFLGYKNNAASYLNFFDVYVMSSYSEGFPLSLLEAAQIRLPIVCSDIPIFRELFDTNNVVFFENDNIHSLSESIKFCYNNKEKLSQSFSELIKNNYSVNKMSEKYYKLYKNKKIENKINC